jgi:hypothetical protein
VALAAYKLVPLANGARGIHSLAYGETMHPAIGPAAESVALYVKQLRLVERIREHAGEFVIWDIGLGAAANALAVLRSTRHLSGAIRLVSFDDTIDPLQFALNHAEALGYLGGYESHTQTLLEKHFASFRDGEHAVKWEIQPGDFPTVLARLLAASPIHTLPEPTHPRPLPGGEPPFNRIDAAHRPRRAAGIVPAYLFSVGSTGDPPVPSGDPPDGMESSIERKGTTFSHSVIAVVPPGGSPGGAGGSPALPSLSRHLPAMEPEKSSADRIDRLSPPHAILFDPFSPAKNPAMWTLSLFTALFRLLDPSRPCALATYSRSTMTRAALLLAGFYVGAGHASGDKEETTVAANALELIGKPLDRRWLERARRSHSAEPLCGQVYRQARLAPATWERLRRHRQFR